MIQRYALYDIQSLRDRFLLPSGLPKGIKAHYNIRPTSSSPVITMTNSTRHVVAMHWGMVSRGAANANSVFRYKTHTVKSEKIFDQASTSTLIRKQRCLVPVNGFFQWDNTKQPYYLHRPDNQLFALAGIYGSWQHPNGDTQATFAIVTVADTGSHLPVIVHPDDEATWLDQAVDDMSTLYDIMRPYPDDVLLRTAVNSSIVTSRANSPQFVAPL